MKAHSPVGQELERAVNRMLHEILNAAEVMSPTEHQWQAFRQRALEEKNKAIWKILYQVERKREAPCQ